MNKIKLIVIGGPTASGKTDVSLELAKMLDSEIISYDSRQVFKYLDIGTAKPTQEELAVAKHHFIDCLELTDYFSAGRFAEEAYPIIQNLNARGKTPILVGGTGFYVDALCNGMFDEEKSDNSKRKEITKKYDEIYKNEGSDKLVELLKEVDPKAVEQYADKNHRRLIRALEYYEINGKRFSEANQELPETNLEPHFFGVEWDREMLYNRINLRTELMWEKGLIEETQKVLDMGYSSDLNSLHTVGYKECIKFLDGEWEKSFAIEEMKKNTRRYAKRQLTWFRRYENMKYLTGNSKEIAEEIIKSMGLG
jgi:tRNA dimethylallyltransferase